jgi:hypothetical protein
MVAVMSEVVRKRPVLDHLAAVTEAAKAELDRAIALSGLQRDPLRHSFQALAVHLDAMNQIVSQHIEEARRPIGQEDLQQLVRTVAWQVDLQVARRSMQFTIGGIVAGAVLLGALCYGSYWYGWKSHGDQQLVAGVSAGQRECHEQQGGTLCYIPVWAKLPPQ